MKDEARFVHRIERRIAKMEDRKKLVVTKAKEKALEERLVGLGDQPQPYEIPEATELSIFSQEIRSTMKIPNFHRAVPQAPFCEHLRTKNWGTSYGKGVRCVDCGTELTTTHEMDSQLKGTGSGGDMALDEAIARHRRNEGGFRFKVNKPV